MAAVILSPSFPVNLAFLSNVSIRAEESRWDSVPVALRQHAPGPGRHLLCRDRTYKARSLPSWATINPPNSSIKPPVLPVQSVG